MYIIKNLLTHLTLLSKKLLIKNQINNKLKNKLDKTKKL